MLAHKLLIAGGAFVATGALATGIGLAVTTHAPAPKTVTVTHTVTPKPIVKTVAPKPSASVPAPSAPAPVSAPQQPAAPANAQAVVTQFYQDLTDQDYQAAWDLGGDNIGGVPYAQWVEGYDTTASITISTIGSFSSGYVWANITATQDGGSVKTYYGTYMVANGVIVSADIQQI